MLRRLFVFMLILIMLPMPAWALSGDWVSDDAVRVHLISEINGVGMEPMIPLGLEVFLGEGWHTYWRSPGEAGLPPQLDWTRSQNDNGNIKSVVFHYPAPHRYTAYNLETVGYHDHVVFPIDVNVLRPGQALNAAVGIDLLVCSSICVPKHFDLSLTVPAGAAAPAEEADVMHQARSTLPTDPDSAGLVVKSIVNDGQRLTVTITSRDPLVQPDLFIEDEKSIGFGAPKVEIDTQAQSAALTLKPVDTLPNGVSLAKMPVTLTLVDGDRATEIKMTLPPVASSPVITPAPETSFALALLFALIGGFILNLMPCVLPVLSLKILSIVSHGGGAPRAVRQSFMTTAAGIIFSFLVLANATVALKKFGLALGWGVQFQQPAFLMVLVLLLTFFAANMWGLFDIPLPRFLADRLSKAYHPKLAGDFATGAFATLLATPCSAPFLGTAVGFALSAGPVQIYAIFAALGLGMAVPYLAVAAFPRVATLLPKPGRWMLHLRHALGLALALTALWLTWVLAAQITVIYAVAFGFFMLGITILLMLRKHGMSKKLITLGVIEFCAVALVLGINGAFTPKALPETDRKWIAYDTNAVNADIAEGKLVFIDVTADWCLTCKANMKFTLSTPDVAARLFHSDVVAVQADWTNPDPVITDLLHHYGRYGIPFNIVYGPRAPQGIVLPELLTPALVLDALDKAGAAPP